MFLTMMISHYKKNSIIEGTTFFDFTLCDELKLFAKKKTYKIILIKT